MEKRLQTVEFGWPIGMPICRPLGDGVYEVRTSLARNRIARVLFYVDVNGRMVLLHGFMKKTQKTPGEDLDLPGTTRAGINRGLNERTAMNARKKRKKTDYSGSTFDSFLDEERIREEVQATAIKRVLAWQLERAMHEQQKTKQVMAKQLRTSRSQLDRLLDPRNVSVTLDTMARAARAVGKRLIIRVADVKSKRV